MTKEFGKAPQVLRGCGQHHLILYPAQASQPKPIEFEDALHGQTSQSWGKAGIGAFHCVVGADEFELLRPHFDAARRK
jgi:hypothetical protein